MSTHQKSGKNIPIRKIKRFTLNNTSKPINDMLFKKSGFKKCIQCGRCTASCTAAYLYQDYNPRELMRKFIFDDVYSKEINELIWKCGQCYSCRARCPRNCKAGLGVQSLQLKSVFNGNAPPEIINISKQIKLNLYKYGITFLPSTQRIDLLEEFGVKTNDQSIENSKKRESLGFKMDMTRINPLPEESLQEVRQILELTGFVED